jgi:hypothetical protein
MYFMCLDLPPVNIEIKTKNIRSLPAQRRAPTTRSSSPGLVPFHSVIQSDVERHEGHERQGARRPQHHYQRGPVLRYAGSSPAWDDVRRDGSS